MTRRGGSSVSIPRYRGEERSRELATLIIGFADTLAQAEALLTRRAAQLTRARVAAELVIIDQDSEAIVFRRDIWVPPKS